MRAGAHLSNKNGCICLIREYWFKVVVKSVESGQAQVDQDHPKYATSASPIACRLKISIAVTTTAEVLPRITLHLRDRSGSSMCSAVHGAQEKCRMGHFA